MSVVDTYDGLAAGWEADATAVYAPLASLLVDASPISLDGALALDVGTGTGAVAAVLGARGAVVIGSDRSLSMLRSVTPTFAVGADVLALPLRARSVDAACAGFLLNHMDPEPAFRELARVVRPGGVVLASTWHTGQDHVKGVVDAVLKQWGWAPPEWYRTMKNVIEQVAGVPTAMADAAESAGLVDVHAEGVDADLAGLDPDAVVAYRLAVPHVAPWAATLSADERRTMRAEAVAAVVEDATPWRPRIVLVSARVPV